MITRGTVTQSLDIYYLLFNYSKPLHSTVLLQAFDVYNDSEVKILILPCLEQIKGLEIWHEIISAYSLNIHWPLHFPGYLG